jgi:hypothetical protein
MMPSVRFRAALAALVVSLSAGGCSASTQTSSSAPTDQASAADTLPARWWTWTSFAARDPIRDATGQDCALNQPEDVWFLAGTYGGSASRSCSIPAGRPVYFPVINSICRPRDGVEDLSDVQIRRNCSMSRRSVSAELDGRPLTITEETSGGIFTYGFAPAAAWGEWVGPLELSTGRHVLRFAAHSDEIDLAVTYDLTVGPRDAGA